MPFTLFKKERTFIMGFITSKMAAPVTYAFYTKGANRINVVTDEITVNGGAGVINKRSLETPQGVVTELTDEQIDKLKSHPVFKMHLTNGAVAILGTEKEAKKAEEDLKKDKSSQLTPEDYEKGNSEKQVAPKKSKPKTKK